MIICVSYLIFSCLHSKELMYQQVLCRFAHFNAIQISNPVPLKELIMLALKEEDLDQQCNENDDLKEKIAEVKCLYFRLVYVWCILYLSFYFIFLLSLRNHFECSSHIFMTHDN